ncbi:MAG: hypothetical protein FJ267_00555, partial [Planctomycetes bacterium]|nr:hypothetical protein [Planctomycetota bacterium]
MDSTFDFDGLRVSQSGISEDIASNIAVQPDGKIVVVGNARSPINLDFAVARYNADGTPDLSFSQDGRLVTTVGASMDFATAVAIQNDGKILAAGTTFSSVTGFNFAIVRYNSDGTLDTSFDNDGIVITAMSTSDDKVMSLVIQSDGKIVVGGVASISGSNRFALARYNSNGSLDTTFDSDGKVFTTIGTAAEINGIALQSDGRIVAVGERFNGSNRDFVIARFNTNGSLDGSFDTDGIVTTSFGASDDIARSVALQNDGRIVVAGYRRENGPSHDFALVRYNGNGSLDSSFDGDGIVFTDYIGGADQAHSVVIQPDGKIIAGGWVGYSQIQFGIARYKSNGELDSSFGTGGKQTSVGSPFGNSEGASLALQNDGKILLAGT